MTHPTLTRLALGLALLAAPAFAGCGEPAPTNTATVPNPGAPPPAAGPATAPGADNTQEKTKAPDAAKK